MTTTPMQVIETVSAAQSVMEQLRTRITAERDVLDVGDLVYIQTTIKQIQKLFQSAAEYEEHLKRHLERTRDRISRSTS
ncbi:hypothetical protein [Roseateles sp. DXS20W]|uniref:hypothetical protein n=1 Tax=Pelomonas lactea TaxID=3299030 RepID=UPI003747F548